MKHFEVSELKFTSLECTPRLMFAHPQGNIRELVFLSSLFQDEQCILSERLFFGFWLVGVWFCFWFVLAQLGCECI